MSVRILAEPLSLDRCMKDVLHAGAGAVVLMVGCVRDHTRHDATDVAVTRLDYEAYEAMAHKVIAAIVRETDAKFPGTRTSVEHRTGTLGVGDLAVVVASSAAHRKDAFRACEHVIDRLKEDAPIWKREHGTDGVVWVGMGP